LLFDGGRRNGSAESDLFGGDFFILGSVGMLIFPLGGEMNHPFLLVD